MDVQCFKVSHRRSWTSAIAMPALPGCTDLSVTALGPEAYTYLIRLGLTPWAWEAPTSGERATLPTAAGAGCLLCSGWLDERPSEKESRVE